MHWAAPATAEKNPAGHGVDAIAPAIPTKLPAGASVHANEQVLAANVPALQRVAETAPTALT